MSSLAHFGFLALPEFSMIAFSSAVEVLRMANYVGRAEHYTWSVYSPDGAPVHASNGIVVRPTRALDGTRLPDVMIVCGGIRIRDVSTTARVRCLADSPGRTFRSAASARVPMR